MIGWTNTSGGGLNIQSNKAVIHVTAPVGSTISFEYDGIVVAVLGPKYSFVNADDSSVAEWYYSVSSSNYGTWTVTASKTPFSDTQSVTVDSNKQYDVEVSLPIPLYYEGTYYNDLSGGFTTTERRYNSTSATGKTPTITNNTTFFQYLVSKGAGTYQTANKIDVTDFGVLRISAKGYITAANLRVGADTGATYWENSFAAYTSVNSNSAPNRTTFNIDISGLSGQYYITIGASYLDGTIYGDFYEISLVK